MIFSKLKKRMATPYIAINPHNCVACWECIPACPKHVRIVDADACIGCNKCIRTCSHGVFTSLKNVSL